MKCPTCNQEVSDEYLKITFVGMGDKPCWRIKYGTIDSFWWGPESAMEAAWMMVQYWRDWTPLPGERDTFKTLAEAKYYI